MGQVFSRRGIAEEPQKSSRNFPEEISLFTQGQHTNARVLFRHHLLPSPLKGHPLLGCIGDAPSAEAEGDYSSVNLLVITSS